MGEFLRKMCSASIPIVAELLNDDSPEVRGYGAGLLVYLECDEAIPLLEKVVETEQYLCLPIAILANRKQVNARLLPFLINALDKPQCAEVSCRALKVLGPEAEPAIPALIQCLEKAWHSDSDPSNSLAMGAAMDILQTFGSKAAPAIPVLIEVLGSDSYIRFNAVETLAKIGPEAESALVAAIDSTNVRQREEATSALARIQPYSENTIAVFLRLVEDENDYVREYAAQALGKVDTDAAREAFVRAKEKGEELYRKAEVLEKELAGRVWTKTEIEAVVPPDANHKHPRKLERSLSVFGCDSEEFYVTVHVGRDWPTIVVVWAKQEPDGYKRLWMEEFPCDSGIVGDIKGFRYHEVPFLYMVWINAGSGAYRDDYLFALAPGHRLMPISIEPVNFENTIKEGERVRKSLHMSFSDDSLDFSFYIWNKDDAECCPTAGGVHGTYKVVGDPLSEKEARLVADTCIREEPDSLQ
ncbi:MAG: HEAT repeat domain-containing protein [Candidatus Hydrogenedentes bacterium]|nr:HEAT repeat domain-containing protein [Candidatus Hydrogenedentota bacterium]